MAVLQSEMHIISVSEIQPPMLAGWRQLDGKNGLAVWLAGCVKFGVTPLSSLPLRHANNNKSTADRKHIMTSR